MYLIGIIHASRCEGKKIVAKMQFCDTKMQKLDIKLRNDFCACLLIGVCLYTIEECHNKQPPMTNTMTCHGRLFMLLYIKSERQ